MAVTQPERHSRFQLPSSLQLLIAPGIRGHTMLFMGILGLLFGAAYVGGAIGFASTWTVVFGIGASASASYMVMAILALSERIRNTVLFAKMGRRTTLLASVYGPILAGFSYWIYRAGSVQALPILPYFIGIFYAWILSQAYFIANPITHAMLRFENRLVGEGFFKKTARTLGVTVLFLPIAPLGFGVWEISSWAKQNYANINGSDTYILAWTLIVALLLIATYAIVVNWGWKNIRNGRPQAAVFAGGTFLILWGYLLYRATTTLISVITQSEPSFPIVDIGLMAVAILGAMQTFARKAVKMTDRRWSQALPFVVFSFGSVYAVSQYYFILEGGLTRALLSAIISGTVFATGLLTLLLLLRQNLKIPSAPSSSKGDAADTAEPATTPKTGDVNVPTQSDAPEGQTTGAASDMAESRTISPFNDSTVADPTGDSESEA